MESCSPVYAVSMAIVMENELFLNSPALYINALSMYKQRFEPFYRL